MFYSHLYKVIALQDTSTDVILGAFPHNFFPDFPTSVASSFWVTPLMSLMKFKLFSYFVCTLAICRALSEETYPL